MTQHGQGLTLLLNDCCRLCTLCMCYPTLHHWTAYSMPVLCAFFTCHRTHWNRRVIEAIQFTIGGADTSQQEIWWAFVTLIIGLKDVAPNYIIITLSHDKISFAVWLIVLMVLWTYFTSCWLRQVSVVSSCIGRVMLCYKAVIIVLPGVWKYSSWARAANPGWSLRKLLSQGEAVPPPAKIQVFCALLQDFGPA